MSRGTRLLLLGVGLGFVAGWLIASRRASLSPPDEAFAFESGRQTVSLEYREFPEPVRALRSATPFVTNPVPEIPRATSQVRVPSAEEQVQAHQAAIKRFREDYVLKDEAMKTLETNLLSMVGNVDLKREEILAVLDTIATGANFTEPVPRALEQTLRDWRTHRRIREAIYLRILQETVDLQTKTNSRVGE